MNEGPIMTEGAMVVLLVILAQLFREAETLGRAGRLDSKSLWERLDYLSECARHPAIGEPPSEADMTCLAGFLGALKATLKVPHSIMMPIDPPKERPQ